MLGGTQGAKGPGARDESRKMVKPLMGVPHWDPEVEIEPEVVTVAFDGGRAVGEPADVIRELNTVGGRHGIGMSHQIQNPAIEAKSRGPYQAPRMARPHVADHRPLTAAHNDAPLESY